MTAIVPGAGASDVSARPSPGRPSSFSTPSTRGSSHGECNNRVSAMLPVRSSEANPLGLAAAAAASSAQGRRRPSCGSDSSSRTPAALMVNAGDGNTSFSSSSGIPPMPDYSKGWRSGSSAHGSAAGGNARHGGHAGSVTAAVNRATLVGGTGNGGVGVSAGGG